MTVGETLTASSLGTATAVGQTSVPEPVQIDSRQKPLQTGSEVNQPMVVAGPGGNLPGQGPSVNVVTAKIGQELVTSLHLIKDIRRLEKYQRDFFLKVSTYNVTMIMFVLCCISSTFFLMSFVQRNNMKKKGQRYK